jgi:hypothetical protein
MVTKGKIAEGNGRTAAAEQLVRERGDLNQVLKGKATVIRRVAVAGDPKATDLPKFDCGEGKMRSVFLGLDHARIVELGAFLAEKDVLAKGGTFEATKAALEKLLKEFNQGGKARGLDSNAVLAIAPDPCSMPDHVWTGGGCRPKTGGGQLLSLTIEINGKKPTTLFGKVHNPTASFAFGYCISVDFS